MTVVQKKGETLREYISCFNSELTGVEGCEKIATVALREGLQPGLFWESLTKRLTTDDVELLVRA